MSETFTIVGFGNSITQATSGMPDPEKRWLNVLGRQLRAEFPSVAFNVVNAGVGGNSAREAMARFDADVLAHDPDVIVLEFGGNNTDPARPERRVDLEEFKGLLEEYKRKLPEKTRTIVVTFPPVFQDWHPYGKNPEFIEHFAKTGGMEKTGDLYRNIVREFSRSNGFPLFDLHAELVKLGQRNGCGTYTLCDGVHLTEDGNKVLADGVFEKVKTIVPNP